MGWESILRISRQTSGDKKKRNTSFMRITKVPPSSPLSPLKQDDAQVQS